MSASPRNTAQDLESQREELTRQQFEPQLVRLGLGLEQIKGQTLEELNQSLVKINDAISHPESFGTLKIKITARAALILTSADSEAHIEIGILPLLLERKSLILKRIRELGGVQNLQNLGDLIASVSDAELRDRLNAQLSNLSEQSRRLAEQESAVAHAQAEQLAQRDETLARLSAEMLERRLKAWTDFFAKESMATYIGAFLLVTLTFVQITSMFLDGIRNSEIINNAFLLLLGYFFGQSITRKGNSSGG